MSGFQVLSARSIIDGADWSQYFGNSVIMASWELVFAYGWALLLLSCNFLVNDVLVKAQVAWIWLTGVDEACSSVDMGGLLLSNFVEVPHDIVNAFFVHRHSLF